jgi:signal transduction histidine kinase
MKIFTLKYYLFISVFFLINFLFGNSLVLNKEFNYQSVTPFLSAYPCSENKITSIERINRLPDNIWKKVSASGFKKKIDTRIWWLKFKVKCSKSGRYYLENQYPLLEHFQLFQVINSTIKNSGNYGLRNPARFSPKQKYPTYALELINGKTYTFYFKLYKKFAIPSQPISLYSEKAYLEASNKDEREYGWIFGIIAVLIFMGMLTGTVFRLKIYFYYTFYMIALGGILYISNGYFRLFTPHKYLLEVYFTMYYCIISTFFALYLMLYKLFDIKTEFPRMHKIIQWKIVATFINMAINQTAFFYWPNYPLVLYEIGNVLLILYPLFLFVICYRMYLRYKVEKALYFLLLFTFTLIFTVFFSLLPFSIVSHNQLMIFRWIIVFEGIAVLLILHRDLYRSKIDAIVLQKNLAIEEKKSMENYINGLLDERNRIAVELHDSVSANLTALGLKMKNNPKNESNSFYFEELKKIQEDVRKTSHDLHPITLNNNSLIATIELEIARLENYFEDITFNFSYTNEIEINLLNQQLKEIFYFTCCELIQNVLKHALPTEVKIELVIKNKSISLIVSDDGIGYQAEKISKGLGLTTIEKRAVLLNGSFSIEKKEKGMVHRFKLPI